MHPEFPEAPGLYAQLANVYLHLNRRTDAGQQYLAAAEIYARANHGKEAREMLDRVNAIRNDLSPGDLDRLYVLQERVQKLPIV